jgi:Flp pilus assembly pilin Flp
METLVAAKAAPADTGSDTSFATVLRKTLRTVSQSEWSTKRRYQMFEIFMMQIRHVRDMWADRKGISSLEYGVLAVGIVAAVAAGAVLVGTRLTAVFGAIVKELGG